MQFIGVDMITHMVENIGSKVDGLMKKVEKSQATLGKNMIKGGQAAVVAGGILEAAALGEGAAMLKLAENVATAGHAQHDLSEQMGISAHQAGIWAVVADTVGVDTGQLAVGYKTLAKNMEALKLLDQAGDTKLLLQEQQLLSAENLKLNELKKTGNKHLVEEQQKLIANTQAKIKNMEATHAQAEAMRPLQAIFDQLHVNIRDSTGALLPMDTVMLQVADAFQKMPDGAEKSAIAIKLFGRSGVDLISMLNEGSDGIKKFMQEAELSGKVLSTSETEEAEKAFRANQKLKQAIAGVTTQLALAFLPILEKVLAAVTPWLHNMADWIQHHQKLLTVIVPLVIILTALFGGLLMLAGVIAIVGGAVIMLPAVLAAVGVAMGAIAAAAIPVAIILAIIVAVALAVWFAVTHWDQIKAIAASVWQAIVEMGQKIAETFSAMITAVVAIWTDFWKHPLYYVGLVVGFVIGSVIRIHDEVTKWLSKLVADAVTWLIKLPENFRKTFDDIILAIAQWAVNALPSMVKAGGDLKTALWNELKSLPGKAVNLGIDIAKGLLKGLTSIPGEVKKGAGDLVNGLLGGIKTALGNPHSPAPATVPLGLSMAQGIGAGLLAGAPGVHGALGALVGPHSIGPRSKAAAASQKHAGGGAGGGGSFAGKKVEELLQEIVNLLKDGALGATTPSGGGKGALSPYDILAAFNHLVESAQMQRSRGTRAGFVQ